MLEPWRSQYLRALGVEIYLPRFPLPGAAPSLELEWDDFVAAEIEQLAAVDEPVPGVSMPRSSPSAVLPDGGLKSAPAARNVPASAPTVPVSATPALRIKLIVAASDSGVLIIDEAVSNTRNDSQRLLTSLLFALQGKPANLKIETFDWPLPNLRNRSIELNEDAARETLTGLLQRKVVEGDVRTILLLGANAQRWIDVSVQQALTADRQLVWGKSLSTAAVLNDLTLKRQWWTDLRAIETQ
ncbi:MAG: hypothetical protein ABW049_05845 [Spongiibacteraceae bacterium]